MNESKDFLRGKLEELFKKFEGIKIRYEFRDYMSLHLIEILPLETFENNQDFVLEEIKIQDEFENFFGETEEILFVSSDSLNEIKSAHFKLGYEVEEVVTTNLVNRQFSFSNYLKEEVQKVNNTSYALAA